MTVCQSSVAVIGNDTCTDSQPAVQLILLQRDRLTMQCVDYDCINTVRPRYRSHYASFLSLRLFTPCGAMATDHSSPSSSILDCCHHLITTISEAFCFQFLLQISLTCIPSSSYSSLTIRCPFQHLFANALISSSQLVSKPVPFSSSHFF